MTAPHEDQSVPRGPTPRMIGTAGMIDRLRGPASHVIVDVVDPGVGGATAVRQAMTSLGMQPEKPSTSPALLLTGGIVVAALVVSAGVVDLTPAVAALVFAAAIVVWLRASNHRARRTDENTRWASRSGQAFGAWDPEAPSGRRRLLLDHRGLAVVDLGVQREPMAVLLWKSVERLILVPGSERSTDPGLVVHRTDGRVAGFTTAFSLHELMPALDDVGLPTDIEQAMAGATSVRRPAAPLPPTPPAPPADPWANVAPPPGALAMATGAVSAAERASEPVVEPPAPPEIPLTPRPTSNPPAGALFTSETPEPVVAAPRPLFPPTPAAAAAPPPPPPPPPPPAPALAPGLDAPTPTPTPEFEAPAPMPVFEAPAAPLSFEPAPAAPAGDPWTSIPTPPGFEAPAASGGGWTDPLPSDPRPSVPPHDSLPPEFPAPPATLADALGTPAAPPAAMAPPPSAESVPPPPPPPPPPPAADPSGWAAPSGDTGALFDAHGAATETTAPATEPPDSLWR